MNWQQRVGETKKGGHADGFQVFGSPGRKWRQQVPALLETLEGGEGNTGFPPSLYIPTSTRTSQTQTQRSWHRKTVEAKACRVQFSYKTKQHREKQGNGSSKYRLDQRPLSARSCLSFYMSTYKEIHLLYTLNATEVGLTQKLVFSSSPWEGQAII